MSSYEIYKSEDYKIESVARGREGYIFYIEKSRLPFDWEIIIHERNTGRGLTIPTSKEWDSYCERHKANWAKGRRDEIVKRIANVLAKKWGVGNYEIVEDRWLNIWFGSSFLERFLKRMLPRFGLK